MSTERPRVLIEDWLPVKELGIESRRERAAASALPPLSFLHVWWARRPLVASAGVVLAGLVGARLGVARRCAAVTLPDREAAKAVVRRSGRGLPWTPFLPPTNGAVLKL